MREVGKALGDDLSRYENELAAKNQYRSTIRKKAALIVVDDVWRSSDLEPMRAEDSPRSRLLFTTRDASIAAAMGAREHVADLLTEEQSREVLARWSRTEITNLPPTAAQLIHECGRHPLALSMVGAMCASQAAGRLARLFEAICARNCAEQLTAVCEGGGLRCANRSKWRMRTTPKRYNLRISGRSCGLSASKIYFHIPHGQLTKTG